MNSAQPAFVGTRQGIGAIIATVFFTGIFVWLVPQATPLAVQNHRAPSTTTSQNLAAADGTRQPASVTGHQLPFAAESTSSDVSPNAVKATTGVDAVRVRSAIFYADTITDHKTAFTLRMNLFPDSMLTAEFQAPSLLATNSNLYVGTIAGDPEGEFRLNIQDGRVSGTIRAFHKSYQLIPTQGGSHLIAELKGR